MNILFLTVSRITSIVNKGIYSDLLRLFIKNGHSIYVVSPTERRYGEKTRLMDSNEAKILNVKTLNIQKANYIEKGIGMLLLESQYMFAINRYWKDVNFDLILYSTPPITLNGVISQLKKKYNAYTYLMLKDIFPQNAVDLEFFSKTSLLYKMFRRKEKRLYQISDYIGCTSPGNIEFVLKHNKEVVASKLNICPNSVELQGLERGDKNKSKLLKRLMIPPTKTLFIYGGNLGKPQGVNFLLQVIEKNEFRQDSFIIVVGGGTDYPIVRAWYDKYKPKNSVLISYLPKTEYDEIVSLCDVGLVFLDRRFTVPNTPSRILPYMEYKMPILFATDAATDVGQIAEANNFGLWTVSGNLTQFMDMIQYMSENEGRRKSMGEAGYQFLKDNYTVEHSYRAIMERFK